MKRILVFAEGEGERYAAPCLVKRILGSSAFTENPFVDVQPIEEAFRVGGLGKLKHDNFAEWLRLLAVARRFHGDRLGGVLLLLDSDQLGPNQCIVQEASQLAAKATAAGAGQLFSVAVVFASQEYESWFISAASSLAGKVTVDGLPALNQVLSNIPANPEVSPRDAKKWLSSNMVRPYKETIHQLSFTRLLDIEALLACNHPSFHRLYHAVVELHAAVKAQQPCSTPS